MGTFTSNNKRNWNLKTNTPTTDTTTDKVKKLGDRHHKDRAKSSGTGITFFTSTNQK